MSASPEETRNPFRSRHRWPEEASGSYSALAGRGQNQRDSFFELLMTYETGVNLTYYAARIDEHGCRLSDDSIRAASAAILVQCDNK